MRLIKAAAFALLGYVLYELFVGISESGEPLSGQRSSGRGQRQGQRPNPLTGPGEGETVETQDSDGGSQRHTVGRGVVSR